MAIGSVDDNPVVRRAHATSGISNFDLARANLSREVSEAADAISDEADSGSAHHKSDGRAISTDSQIPARQRPRQPLAGRSQAMKGM
jgi:hypothetical protein